MKRIVVLIITAISLMGCVQKNVYSEYQSVPVIGWNADSVLTYTWSIDDTAATYRILIDVRHTELYPYQNLWFFINRPLSLKDRNAERPLSLKDTIEFYLADERGQWLGKKYGGYIKMPVLYEEAYKFDSIGEYTMTIQQGMRTERLRGVSDVGVIIRKNDELKN